MVDVPSSSSVASSSSSLIQRASNPLIEDLRKKISLETFWIEECKYVRNEYYECEIDLSHWDNQINEEYLLPMISKYNTFCLIFTDVTYLTIDDFMLLSDLFGSKLIGLQFFQCKQYQWTKEIKKLLTKVTSLKYLSFQQTPWIDDIAMEQIIKRYGETLEYIQLENLNITNNTLFQIGKKCTKLKSITLFCCIKLSDAGLIEIAKNNRLKSIRIGHNMKFTDQGINPLFQKIDKIFLLEINNCPNITNQSIATFYEIDSKWGKRRNLDANTLETLIIRDNPNFTSEIMLWLSAATQKLTTIDLRNCPNLHIGKAMPLLTNLSRLTSLSLTGTRVTLSEQDLESFVILLPQLTYLQLIDFPELIDEKLGNLMDLGENLQKISLNNIPFGTNFIESLCSVNPTIASIELIGSKVITDIDIRCLFSVCLQLKELLIHDCPLLTDGAYTRFACLRQLTKLSLSLTPKNQVTTSLLKNLNLCPLISLELHGFQFTSENLFPFLKLSTHQQLTHLSLRANRTLPLSTIEYLLNHFIHLNILDLSESLDVKPDSLINIIHHNPFLSYKYSTNFFGYTLQDIQLRTYTQFWEKRKRYYIYHATYKIANAYLQYRKRIQDQKLQRRENWKEFKVIQIIHIQAVIRGYLVRKGLKQQKKASLVLLRLLRFIANRKMGMRLMRAMKLHNRYVLSRVFSYLFITHQEKRQLLMKQYQDVLLITKDYLIKRTFRTLKKLRGKIYELDVENRAIILYQVNFLKSILKHWKTILHSTNSRQKTVALMFMLSVPITHWNSMRIVRQIELTKHFREKRLKIIAWTCLARDFLEIKRVQLLIPMADVHFQQSFFHRVVGNVFHGLKKYRMWKKKKRKNLALAKKTYEYQNIKDGFYFLHQHAIQCIHQKVLIKQAIVLFIQLSYKKIMHVCFPWKVLRKQYLRRTYEISKDTRKHYLISHGFKDLFKGVIRQRIWREMNHQAELHMIKKYIKWTFEPWKIFRIYNKNLAVLYYKRYLLKIAKKVMFGLRMNVAMNKESARLMKMQLEQKFHDEAKLKSVLFAFCRFQARIRMLRQRTKFQETRVEKLYSIQILQNFFRTCLARKEFGGRIKKQLIGEKVSEDTELDLMREAEVEMRFFMYQEQAIRTIQRVYRGFIGRKQGLVLAIEYSRLKSTDFYKLAKHFHQHHLVFLRAAQAREMVRHRAATDIQKVARGRFARKLYAEMKYQAKVARMAVFVQRAYKRRLAMKQLNAMRRDKYSQIRYNAARRQRGKLLRALGFPKRKQQKILAPILAGLGLDPISFNYRFGELFTETINDFWTLVGIYHREKVLLQENGLNSVGLAISRRRVLAAQGWKYHVREAVRIIEPGHQYEGYTGIIVRIDESLLGVPMYEVHLDHFPRQTFVRMTTDPLHAYVKMQPLTKIQNRPYFDPPIDQPHAIFGLDTTDAFFTKKNVYAAWRIQQAYRMYRSRQITARKRFELWKRNINRQRSLLSHLSETNTFSAHGLNFIRRLDVHSTRPVAFEELRHKIQPSRLSAHVRKPKEHLVINKEFEARYKDRLKFLQKSAIIQGKKFFATGFERITFNRKMKMFMTVCLGMFRKGGTGLRDLFGARGVKFMSKQASMVTGIDKYCFDQFRGSPHVRYYKTSLYQGEWSGIPIFTPLKPHGEGIIVFLDGWGFAKEDKVLYLTVIRCRYLNAMDLTTSDPYCDIHCNGINLQTSIKWANLNPEFHESFEIDVTNPMATLNIIVKDKDYFGSDDFMGQIVVPLSDFADGKEHTIRQLLKGEDVKIQEDFDRGEIEIRVRWSERIFEDDQILIDRKNKMVIRIQAWSRRIAALTYLRHLRKERFERMLIVKRSAVKITNTCRIRLARKEFKRRFRFLKSAIKIQKRVRIWIAKRVMARKKFRWHAAIRIQTVARIYLAKMFVKKMREQEAADLDKVVAIIQKYVRRMLALKWYRKKKLELAKERMKYDEDGKPIPGSDVLERIPVSEWIDTYGVDLEYGLKRNRRITERLFKQMLKMRFVRLISRYGIVYVDSYPPKLSEDEILQELNGNNSNSLTNRDDFVTVFFPPFRTIGIHRKKAIEMFHKYNHFAFMHLPTTINMRSSVNFIVTTIQCAQRQRVARAEYAKMLRVHKAIILFQRIFRRRYERYFDAAIRITATIRKKAAMKKVRFLRKERNCATIIQCAYRCYVARSQEFNLRSVKEVSVLKSTISEEHHGAEKALEHRSDTFWIANHPDKAEIRVEFLHPENIVEVWIQTSTYSASPNYVTISAFMDKKIGYQELIDREELQLLKGERWHHFVIPGTITKYMSVTFYSNYGDKEHISVRQIRFLKTKEKSATIVRQPNHYILAPGPCVGEEAEIVLNCEADGWPHPAFQWYYNDEIIEGATEKELKLMLTCPAVSERKYRCIKCKMVSKYSPMNAYHVQCGNCSYQFIYKEAETFDRAIADVRAEEVELNKSKDNLITSKIQMESFQNDKYKNIIDDFNVQIDAIDEQLQILREKRYKIKLNMDVANHYTNEGIYYCIVTNYRGGTFKIKRKSLSSVVLVERPKAYIVEVSPYYNPRPQTIRKKWNIYSSILGTFRKGQLDGLVTIRYIDGSYYEGPYVSEDAMDNFGKTKTIARQRNHYGIYKFNDGRAFEGYNVDNHFDPYNLQSCYRVTFPNGEVYEGNFCDEYFHGHGMYTYKDGSVYEGNWHRGTRFGHGHFRSIEGWTYEGFFDKDRRHRRGVIDWPDGSCYMGDWYYDNIQGKGIFITPLRDVYKGELKDGKFHGKGEMVYSDGSTYIGDFFEGKRHGLGIFIDRDGAEYYGKYENDLKEGEFLVKLIIAIEEKGQDNYEVKIGDYKEGNLIKWKGKFSNPIATKQFVSLFRKNREMFDSVYSMILAKNLPALPEGIDANNPQVKFIVFKIRTEAGMLVGQQALNQAQAQLDALLKPLQEKKTQVEGLKHEIEILSMKIIALEKEANDYFYRFRTLMQKYEKDTSKIEQFWLDEPRQVRRIFMEACKKLDTITVDEYFAFRNHRVVPIFVKKILDAISYLLRLPIEFKDQQMIISDAQANGRAGDEEALRLNYHCKLAYLMKEYHVYNYIQIDNIEELMRILADVRFRSDSYYILSTGTPGPVLVDWIKSNYAYIRAAKDMYTILNAAEEKKVEGFRFKALNAKKRDEINELQKKLEITRDHLKTAEFEMDDLQTAVIKASDLLQFIVGRYTFGETNARSDYYKLLEQKLEAKKDFFTIEVCLQGIIEKVLEKNEIEKKTAILQAFATGKQYEEPFTIQYFIMDWIREEVCSQQNSIRESGRTLGYFFEPLPTDVSKDYTTQIISLVVDIVASKMNDKYNDMASAKSWISMKGKKFTTRFLFIWCWKVWEQEALIERDRDAIEAWEKIFGDLFNCAVMAIEAKVNHRMSSIARAQGKVWASHHPDEIKQAEVYLSGEFQNMYPSTEEAAYGSLDIEASESEEITPALRAMSLCWMNQNSDAVRKARDAQHLQLAEQFEDTYSTETGQTCFRILNGMGNEEEIEWFYHAQYWKDFNLDAYDAAAEIIVQEMCKDFVDLHPLSTFYEAAKMIENDEIAKFIPDEEVKAQFAANPKNLIMAYAWGTKNQGMLRKGRDALAIEQKNTYRQYWADLITQTGNFEKGTALLPTLDEHGHDRFFGFRNRLINKFSFIYGYLCRQREIILKDLNDLSLNDPIYKVLHRVRPSEREKVEFDQERIHLSKISKLQKELTEIMEKLSIWNTYFGWNNTNYDAPTKNEFSFK